MRSTSVLSITVLLTLALVSTPMPWASVAPAVADQTPVGVGLYEENSPEVALEGGPWVEASSTADSGGSVAYTTGAGSSASLNFSGTSIQWLARTSPKAGLAEVRIDGQLVDTVDLYSAQTKFQQVVFAADDLAAGNHTITVTRTGRANPQATSTVLQFDAFNVPEPRDQTPVGVGLYEENSPEVALEGGPWVEASSTADSGGSVAYTTGAGSSASLNFSGTSIQWLARTSPKAGLAEVRIDGQLVDTVDLYSAQTKFQQVVFAADDLAAGNHTITVTRTGRANPQATSTVLQFDAFNVPEPRDQTPVGVGLYEENSPEVALEGGPWVEASSTADSGGSVAYTTGAGSSASLNFSGTSIQWLARTSPKAGLAEVRIDGQLVDTVDLYSAQTKFQQVVFAADDLAAGNHTITVTRTGRANPQATSTVLQFDAFNVPERDAPAAPTEFTARAHNSGVLMRWTPSVDEDVIGYRIYRSASRDGSNARLVSGQEPYPNSSFMDVDLPLGTEYTFWVEAEDRAGNRSQGTPLLHREREAAVPTSRLRAEACPDPTVTVSSAEELRLAISKAVPGTSIWLAPGVYGRGYYMTQKGSANDPIWICGSKDAIIDASQNGQQHGFYLSSTEHVRLAGFTVRNSLKGVMVNGSRNIAVSDLTVENIGDEAIHLRESTTRSVVAGNTIRGTGRVNPYYGEGIYVGSSNRSWCAVSDCAPDQSNGNLIEDNKISGTTAEGIELKEGTSAGWVRNNHVDGASMSSSTNGLIHVRGDDWEISDNTGANAQSHAINSLTTFAGGGQGFANQFLGNSISGPVPGYGIIITAADTYSVVSCRNSAPGATRGLTNVTCQS